MGYNFLRTSKLIINPRNGTLARESSGLDDHVSKELSRKFKQWQKTKLNL